MAITSTNGPNLYYIGNKTKREPRRNKQTTTKTIEGSNVKYRKNVKNKLNF